MELFWKEKKKTLQKYIKKGIVTARLPRSCFQNLLSLISSAAPVASSSSSSSSCCSLTRTFKVDRERVKRRGGKKGEIERERLMKGTLKWTPFSFGRWWYLTNSGMNFFLFLSSLPFVVTRRRFSGEEGCSAANCLRALKYKSMGNPFLPSPLFLLLHFCFWSFFPSHL